MTTPQPVPDGDERVVGMILAAPVPIEWEQPDRRSSLSVAVESYAGQISWYLWIDVRYDDGEASARVDLDRECVIQLRALCGETLAEMDRMEPTP